MGNRDRKAVKAVFKVLITTFVPAISINAYAGDTIQTKVPEAHVKAFQEDCQADGVTDASCWCMVEKLNATRYGAFLLDMAGMHVEKLNEVQRLPAMLRLTNRHGLRRSEAIEAVRQSKPILADVAKQCE